MSITNLTEDDEGKRVVTSGGDEVGMITEVRGETAFVEPDPGMFDKIKANLDWGDAGEDTYPIGTSDIEAVTDDEVRLRRF